MAAAEKMIAIDLWPDAKSDSAARSKTAELKCYAGLRRQAPRRVRCREPAPEGNGRERRDNAQEHRHAGAIDARAPDRKRRHRREFGQKLQGEFRGPGRLHSSIITASDARCCS